MQSHLKMILINYSELFDVILLVLTFDTYEHLLQENVFNIRNMKTYICICEFYFHRNFST